jgi:hypothetical protein
MFGNREKNPSPSGSEHAYVRTAFANPFRIWGASLPIYENMTLSNYSAIRAGDVRIMQL